MSHSISNYTRRINSHERRGILKDVKTTFKEIEKNLSSLMRF